MEPLPSAARADQSTGLGNLVVDELAAELMAMYEEDKRSRTYAGLRASRSFYSDQDCAIDGDRVFVRAGTWVDHRPCKPESLRR